MKITTERENDMFRVLIDFYGVEKPSVAEVLRRLLSDYRRSFDAIRFNKDFTEPGNKYFTEVYIRKDDINRLHRLLKMEA